MFTGIINHIGVVHKIEKKFNKDLLVTIELTNDSINSNLDIGCSIACSGICLTLLHKKEENSKIYLIFQVSTETVDKTNIINWKLSTVINVEFSLKVGDEVGGHFISGHIDGTAIVESIHKVDQSHCFAIRSPDNLKKFICEKGSVALNGVSLTVNKVIDNIFYVNLISHSFSNTNFTLLKIGDLINLEVDIMARYVNRLLDCKF